MPPIRAPRIRLWKPRFTIGGLMVTIFVIAIVLTAMRPLAGFAESAYPGMAQTIRQYSTVETGAVLSCLAVGAFVTLKLMSLDEPN